MNISAKLPGSSPGASPGARFRAALVEERPLQVVGAINAYAARMAAACGFKALYLSGGGVAANSLGVPDLGISTLDDVLIDIRRITDACPLPLPVGAGRSIARARSSPSSSSAPPACTSKIRFKPSAAAIGRAKRWFRNR